MVALVFELKTVVGDTEVKGVLDVTSVVSYAGVKSTRAMWLDKGGDSEAVMEGKHLDGEVIVFTVEVKSSVVEGIWVILLNGELAGTTEELDDPHV